MYTIGNVNFEWESTISIRCNEFDYFEAFNNANNTCDVIFLFNNGVRLSNRTIQKKITTNRRRLLTYYQNEWTPIERTIATEENAEIPTNLTIDKCIHRVIVNTITNTEQDVNLNGCNVRISYNKEVCSLGEKYTIEYEIEYPTNSKYEDILRYERLLIRLFLQNKHTIRRDIMTRIDMFSCVMSKVQTWNCFNPEQDYIWAYKWNGIKSKILITDKRAAADDGDNDENAYITYVWSDDSTISNRICRGRNIKHLINICCAVEIMNDRIVIIEAIGTMINGEIFTTEPMTNASFLKKLHTLLDESVRIDNTPVVVQQFFRPPLPNEYGKDCDGFIIIQNDLIIKWKIPTIDVKCITPYTFKVGSTTIPLAFVGEPGKIYEITYKYEVLRQRTDRLAASSDQEYQVFLESSKLLNDMETIRDGDGSNITKIQ